MKYCVTLLTALLLAHVTVLDAADARPNVLFLFADDQRADTIAAVGNSQIKTPNLDRLVRRGLAFDRAYMQGGLNGATCVPSRAMLLSGRCLFRVDEKLLRDETWPAAFGRTVTRPSSAASGTTTRSRSRAAFNRRAASLREA